MSIKDRLIQFVLRGKDELSPAAQKSAEAMQALKDEADKLGKALDQAKSAQGLAKGLESAKRAAEQSEKALVQADLQVKELRDALNKSPDSAGLVQSLKSAEAEGRRLGRQLNKLQEELSKQEQAAKDAGINTDNLSDEQKRLTAELDKNKSALKDNEGALKKLEAEQAKTARTTAETTTNTGRVTGALEKAGNRVLAFAAAYVSLNAAMGLVRGGLTLIRNGLQGMLDVGERFEKLDRRMVSLMGSIAEGEKATAWIREFANDTGQRVGGVADAFAMLKSYGLDPMDGSMQALTDKAEQLGGGLEILQGITAAIGQMWAKEKIQQEEVLQLVERGVNVWPLLSKALGKTTPELQDLATKGKLGRNAVKLLIDEIGKSAQGSAAAGLDSLTGKWNVLLNSIESFANKVATSGAMDAVKERLQGLIGTIDQMSADGSLDRLAQGLSNAFVQGVEWVEKFARRLTDVDFNKLTDDSSRWLNEFGSKLDDAAVRVQLFAAPFRTLGATIVGGLSQVLASFVAGAAQIVAAVGKLGNVLPDMLGGKALKEGTDEALATLTAMYEALSDTAQQNVQDIAAAWDTNTRQVTASAKEQADAVANELAKQAELQAHANALVAQSQQAARDAAIQAAIDGTAAIENIAQAVNLIDTASTVEQLDGLRAALLKAYQDGSISQQDYANSLTALNGRLTKIKGAAVGAAGGFEDLEDALGSLKQVQDAISNARTDVDVNKIRAALKKLYEAGKIDAREYAKAQDDLNTKVGELKAEADKSTRAVRDQGKALDETTSKGTRGMRAVGDATEEASSNLDFFGRVLSAAREPLAAMSKAALELFDAVRGIKPSDLEMDMSSAEKSAAALAKVRNEIYGLQAELAQISGKDWGFGIWARQTVMSSKEIQAQFLAQKVELQKLNEAYAAGAISSETFASRAQTLRGTLKLLDESDLSQLDSAIAGAQQRMQQLEDASRSTLESLQDELDKLEGRESDIESRRMAARKRELEAQLAEAQKDGDNTSVANLQKALQTLTQISAATALQRQQSDQKKRIDEHAAKAAQPQQAQQPTQIIRLESKGKTVDVMLPSGQDQSSLLSILEDAGMKSL